MENLLNKIHFADCLEVLRSLPDGSVNLFLQDPPYNTTNCAWDNQIELDVLWDEWKRVGTANAAFVFTATNPFAFHLIGSNPKMFKYDLVWIKNKKTNQMQAKRMPMRNHENILVFYSAQPSYNPIGEKVKYPKKNNIKFNHTTHYKISGEAARTYFQERKEGEFGSPGSVVYFDMPTEVNNKNWNHPTQKPIDLFRYLIRTYSNPGDVVFDGYGGSGTTAIAAQMEGRKFIVCENHLPYFEASQARLSNLVAAPSLFSDCG